MEEGFSLFEKEKKRKESRISIKVERDSFSEIRPRDKAIQRNKDLLVSKTRGGRSIILSVKVFLTSSASGIPKKTPKEFFQ